MVDFKCPSCGTTIGTAVPKVGRIKEPRTITSPRSEEVGRKARSPGTIEGMDLVRDRDEE